MLTKGPGSPRKNDKKIELDYIHRQAVLLRGGSLVPPAKGCKFVERKRKEKKRKRGERKTENSTWKDKGKRKRRKVIENSSEFREGGNKIRKL